MKDLSYSQLLTENRTLGERLQSEPYRICLLSNITVNPLVEILEYALRTEGLNATVTAGDYDNIVQDSARLGKMDAAVVFWEVGNLIDGLHAEHYGMPDSVIDELVRRVETELTLVFSALQNVPLVLFNQFSALTFSCDELRDTALTRIQTRLNDALSDRLTNNVIPVNIDRITCCVGLDASVDYRQFLAAKSLYSISWLRAYADHVSPAFRAIAGKARKVLILDCDNTLWGGILGEDGASNLRMSDLSRPGKAFREVQQLVKGMRSEGILLALCSKNNPEDVDEVLDTHPDILLHKEDFVARKINWRDKASNLREMAAELNLDLDSFVFVDDSDFELGLVSEELPEVAVLKVPSHLPDYPPAIRQLRSQFFTLSQSAEDARKTEMYRAETGRSSAKKEYDSIEDYLRSLELQVELMWDSAIPAERVAQLTQKTNQFNLTTRRYTEADIKRFASDERHVICAFTVRDRFGEYGVTGVVILLLDQGRSSASIDSLLMSCRVLGRNIEFSVFDAIADTLCVQNIRFLTAEYLRTPKNSQVSDYFDKVGMRLDLDDGNRKAYSLELEKYQFKKPDYIEVSPHAG